MLQSIYGISGLGAPRPIIVNTPATTQHAPNAAAPRPHVPVVDEHSLVHQYHHLQRQIGINGGVHPLYYEKPHWEIKGSNSSTGEAAQAPDHVVDLGPVAIAERQRHIDLGMQAGPLPSSALVAAQNYRTAVESFS